jgi:hypothetical protein
VLHGRVQYWQIGLPVSVKVLLAVNKKIELWIKLNYYFLFSSLRQIVKQIFGILVTGRIKLGHAIMQLPIRGQLAVVQVGLLRYWLDWQDKQLDAVASVQV